MDKDVFEYILSEEASYKTVRIPITDSKDWNMHEHIERCTNVANAWFHSGKNDGLRPYNDLVSPIIDVAFRLEGFNVKDIIPFVENADKYYMSFLVKKYHPQYARKNKIDTFIDEVVESSVVYDLALVKDVNGARPAVVPLQTIAFCDQTDVLAGPLALKHQYTIGDLNDYRGKWYNDKIDEAITMSKSSKTVSNANDKEAKTPGKYIEVYELHGMLPEHWLEGTPNYVRNEDVKFTPQLHIVTYYVDAQGDKVGICLYKGKEPKSIFRALKIDGVKSFGRACGRSLVERLFEPQVWANYDGIKIKQLLDSAVNLFQTDSDEYAHQKLTDLKFNTILKHETGKPITRVDGSLQNLSAFQNHQAGQENNARVLGSASEAALGKNPNAGTPFALQQLIVQEGQGIHEYRQGKISTFFADVLYPDFMIDHLVKDMDGGKDFSEMLTLDELAEVADQITSNTIEKRIKDQILSGGKVPTKEAREEMKAVFKEEWLKKNKRSFFKTVKGELKKIPLSVYVNIAGKQKAMVQNADKISNLITRIMANPQAFVQIPGLGKTMNQLLEESGLSPIDFSQIVAVDPVQLEEKPAPVEAAA